MTSSAPRGVCYGWGKTFSLHLRHGRQRSGLTAEPAVIDYETFAKIHDCRERQGLTIAQTARALGLDPRTVATWVARSRFEPRRSRPRGSVLDPFKPRITRLLDTHPYSAQQIFQRLREDGYRGGVTILRDYVRRIRPTKRPVYLKLDFAPGECAQVDWGAYGTVAVGNTRRRLSFFVVVLAFSRQMYVEFTVSQTMEHFLACHEHAFAAFGGVPAKIMVDNLKSAVLQRLAGAAPVFNPRYLDFARHHGFAIEACNVARGNEKGRVESGVGYVKKNFLHGLELADFRTVHAAAQVWLDTIANVRIHGATQQRPVDLLAQERAHLAALNPHPYDLAHTSTSVASSQFRITLDTNQHSVPAAYAHRRLTVKAYPDRVCLYFDNQLIARHTRRYGRHEDIEDPDHAKGLIAQRSRAREQRLMMHFLALSPDAQAYYDGLEQRRLNARHHVRKILALAEIYAADAVARAISDGLAFQAFSAEYITNILETRARALPEPGPLQLTRRHDLLDIDIAPPDLNAYQVNQHDPE
jgi:transposase